MSGEFSIVARAPIVRQSSDSYNEQLRTEGESYVITDSIGFDTAKFTLIGPDRYLIDWFQKGLVRDVTWTAPDSSTAWEGFVNRLSLTMGDITKTYSIDSMANRVLYIYTPIDTTANPPEAGAITTIEKNDTDSQSKYGIKLRIESGGECVAATADDMALSILTQYKRIQVGEKDAIGQGKVASLKVDMQGYSHMGNWWYYSQTGNTGTDDADDIILLVLAADPNSVLSTVDVNVDTNTLAVEKYWDGKQTGWKIVQTIAARGNDTGGVGYRWHVGVYEGRRTTYKAAEAVDDNGVGLSTNKYLTLHRHLFDHGSVIRDSAGQVIRPWQMRPDRLLYTAGIPGEPMYIEQVKVDLPRKVTLTGTDDVNPLRNYVSGGCG